MYTLYIRYLEIEESSFFAIYLPQDDYIIPYQLYLQLKLEPMVSQWLATRGWSLLGSDIYLIERVRFVANAMWIMCAISHLHLGLHGL